MNEGWIKIHRQLQYNELWTCEKFTKAQAWIDLLLLANHKQQTIFVRGNEIVIKRGCLAYSEDSLAKKWKWSRNKVRRFKKWLETKQQVIQHKNPILSLLEIINYDAFQLNGTTNETTNETTERQQTKQQKDTNKNVKNEKNENKSPLPPCGGSVESFEIFWSNYPKKKNRIQALAAFRKVCVPVEVLVEAINKQKQTDQWKKDGGKYIPYPSTWLNAGAWEDDVRVDVDPDYEAELEKLGEFGFARKYGTDLFNKIYNSIKRC